MKRSFVCVAGAGVHWFHTRDDGCAFLERMKRNGFDAVLSERAA